MYSITSQAWPENRICWHLPNTIPALFHCCFLLKSKKFDLILFGVFLLNSISFTEQLGTYSITNTLVGGRNTWISDTDPGFVITWCGECLFSSFCIPFASHLHCKKKVFVPLPSRDVTNQTLPGREYFIFSRPQGEIDQWHPGLGREKGYPFLQFRHKSVHWAYCTVLC